MPASTPLSPRVKKSVLPPEAKPQPAASAPAPVVAWYRTTWFLSLASSLGLWLSQSPLNLAALAWVAPLGWLLLIRAEKMPGRRAYGVLYLAGCIHWLLVMEGVRRAYWALYLGWFALAAYLAVYIVLFVGLSRVAVHRLRLPLCVAAPTIWVGLELLRGYLLTGFSMGLLAHTQGDFPSLIQVADLGGAYAVSFVVMFVAAAIAETFPWWFGRWQRWPAVAAVGLLVCVFGYGYARMQEATARQQASGKALNVALLQNSVDTIFGSPIEYQVETYNKYLEQARQAAKDDPSIQLMIWPESVFASSIGDCIADEDAPPPPGVSKENFAYGLQLSREHALSMANRVNYAAGGPKIFHIAGTTTFRVHRDGHDIYNSALLVSPQGEVLDRYYKQHRVMFGEYIPLGELFPVIYKLTPMAGGLSRGKESKVFEVAGYKLSPSICFESTVPHLIRRQVRELDARGESPDMLVNVTNDGWFWGSGVLDLHYKCAIFRAVEHRLPMLVAANTGFSTAVDPAGRVLAVGPRREVATLSVAVPAYRMTSFYTWAGDWFAAACLTFTGVCAVLGWRRRTDLS